MPKKEKPKKEIVYNPPISQKITDTLELNYMPYTMKVIVSRAIPEIDGFKPSHRKLLYTMYKMGLLTGGRVKSADVVGQTMRLNPHGDGAIYETLVRLTRGNDTLIHPFIDSKGNFGKHYSRDMAYAASRYTEVKLDSICTEVFRDIDKNTVDFCDNYNGTMKEPMLLPTVFPNVLVTPNQGIAVGMASSICSFNLQEICTATVSYIKNKNIDLLSVLSAPDFSTGGELVYSEKELRQIYETGRGSFKLRAKWSYDSKNGIIEITEIPYTTTIEMIIDKIASLVKQGKIKDINDVRDETDLKGLKIAVDIKKSANPELVMHRLFNQTTLTDSFACNFNVLINGAPKTLGIKSILDEWLIFRRKSIQNKLNYELSGLNAKLHLLNGLSKILLDIDKAISIIRNTEEDKLVIPNLVKGFGIDEIQAEFIAEIKLRNLNKEYLLGKVNELDSIKKSIESIKDILANESKIDDIIVSELKEIGRKYGKPRRTQIVYELESEAIPADVLIEDYALKLFLTEHGYLKKVSLASLRSSGDHYLKDDDKILQEVETANKSELLFFSDRQNVYKMKTYEISDTKVSNLGEYLGNTLELADNEKIVYMLPVTEYTGYMIFGFDNGKIAKVALLSYATKTNRKKLVNAYSDKAKAVYIGYIKEDVDFVVLRDFDKATLFNSALITAVTSKNSTGVQVFTLKKKSAVSKIMPAGEFVSSDIEYYRTDKIPSAGHFISDEDKSSNKLPMQISMKC